jgi:small subunit ribosomal protein S13
MARISGIDLPENKKVDIALTKIFGIGRSNVKVLLREVKINKSMKVKELTEEDINKIQKEIDKNFKVEGDLKTEIGENIKRLKEIGCYRGIRHARGLPSRGQRTRSNARTRRGRRQTVGAMKKEVRAKMEQTQKTN